MNLCELTIAQAHAKLQAKDISAVELTQACLDRIEHVDGNLNAVVYCDPEKALDHAKSVDTTGDFSSPLSGIPYLVKDNFCEKGVPTTASSNILRKKDYRPPYNATTINRLNAVHAISMGKVNCDEFAMGTSNETSCYGPVHNPWNTDCVPGGTSGGSAAAVAADECIFALGSDTGGSIRQPASLSGCTGLKVTYGRTSRYGVIAMASSLDTIGVLSKTAEDAALWLEATAGHDPLDATTKDLDVPQYSACLGEDLNGMTIGIPEEYFIDDLDDEVRTAIEEAVSVLKSLGADVKDVSLPSTKYGVAAYYIICPSEVSSNMARFDGIRYGHTVDDAEDLVDYYFQVRSEGFGDEVKRRIMTGTYALSAGYYDAYYRKALQVRSVVQQDFTTVFEDIDALVTPTSPFPAFRIGEKFNDPIQMYLADVFTIPASLAGICGLNVPCGFSSTQLPIGMQLLGNHWQEQTVLNIGHAYQQATDWHTQKPTL